MMDQAKRLIEVDLPIGVISQHARHEQNIKKGHLHSFHVWWATRPLAACRAVTLAALLPDPADERCPEDFREKAQQALSWMSSRDLSKPNDLRKALLNFIGGFSAWERATDLRWVETARSLVKAAYPDSPPLVVDPFAGIGSIPLEALRLGADAFAGDLNPVATLLLKAVLEDIPRYGQRLAEAVRQWGNWVKEQAEKELRQFYPRDADGSVPLAYLWARQILCEGPGCGAEVPLVGLVWLSRKEKHQVALRIIGDKDEKEVRFEIFEPKSEAEVQGGIVSRFAATCPVCGYTTPYARVREQLRKQQGGTNNARMIAVITLKPDGQRGFRLPSQQDLEAAERAKDELGRRKQEYRGRLSLVPDEPFPAWYSGVFNPGLWNITTWGDLFTPRQALALSMFANAVNDAHGEILQQTGDATFARAVATCIALAVSNLSHYSSDLSYYHPFYGMRSGFGGNGFPMKPDFAEANPFIPNLVGGFDYPLDLLARVIEREEAQLLRAGTVHLGSATRIPLPDQSVPVVVTDPPYYAAVPYADLADFCYVWLKRMVAEFHPDLFRWPLTPKNGEIIAYYVQPPDREPKNGLFFENRMREALAECRRVLTPDGIAIVLFAHKGTAGWEALLKALVEAGWRVTSSWPIETERGARMRAKNSAVLASSVFLVCKLRPANAGIGEWRQVLAELRPRIREWLPRLADGGIEGADAIFSCLGPALEIYSRYERVEKAGGEAIELADRKDGAGKVIERGFLSFVWEAVGTEAMRTIAERHMEGADPLGFEEDARLTTMWLWTIRAKANQVTSARGEQPRAKKETPGYTLPYDDARLLIQALGANEEALKRPGGILEVKGDKASLLFVRERSSYLLGEAPSPRRIRPQSDFLKALGMETVTEDAGAPKSEGTILDRVHQAMLLFADGRSGALRRILEDADEKFSRLANALSALYPPKSEEKRWVEGILARKKSLGL